MAFTAAQKPILAEILQLDPSSLTALLSSLTFSAEDEAWIGEDIDTWEADRNKIKAELAGDVSFKTRRLLDEIRMRVRKAFGLSLYSEDIQQPSGAIANTFVF